VFDADALQTNRHRQMLAAILKKLRSFRSANQMTRKRTRLDATARVKLAEMCNCLLDNTPAHPHAAHQPPITVDLPVLLHRRVAQIHAPKSNLTRKRPERPLVGTTRPNPIFPTANALIRFARRDKSTRQFQPKLRKLGYLKASPADWRGS
jgi:hypothetical protein